MNKVKPGGVAIFLILIVAGVFGYVKFIKKPVDSQIQTIDTLAVEADTVAYEQGVQVRDITYQRGDKYAQEVPQKAPYVKISKPKNVPKSVRTQPETYSPKKETHKEKPVSDEINNTIPNF